MIRTVIVVLALAFASAFAVPLTIQEQEISGIEGAPQTQQGTSVGQQVEKTGVQSSEGYTPIQTVSQQVEKFTLNSGTPEEYTGVNTAQEVTAEKILAQTQSDVHVSQQNIAVPKAENQYVNAEHPQSSFNENPVLLPIQPLSVVPVNTGNQVVQPVVVPAEPIPVGRMIIMAVEPIRPKTFEDVGIVPETQVAYQQLVQPVTYTPVHVQGGEPNQQPYYVQPVQEQAPVQQVQGYSPVQVQPNSNPFVREQTIVPEPVGQVSNYNQAPIEQGVYPVQQNPQRVLTQTSENQVPYQVAAPVNTQSVVQPLQQQQSYILQPVENVVQPFQQNSDYTPVQNQNFAANPTVLENVNQGPYQQSARVQAQPQQYSTQQDVEKHVPHQQNQPGEQPVFNVQPETPEKQGQYQVYSPVQVQSHQQTRTEQQVVEKHVPCQNPVQANVGESVSQQVYSVQPVVGGQSENQVNYQQITQPQTVVGQVSE